MKTVDVIVKEWRDRVNGNTYFAGRIILDYGTSDERTIYMPLQYGYGTQYEYEAIHALQEAGRVLTDEPITIVRYCHERGIIYRYIKIGNCKKREVEALGTAE